VQYHHRVFAELRPPGFEIVAHGLVAVQAVYVQQVDRALGEMLRRLVKGRPHQP
jgi:hypothetical protein